MKRLAPTFLAAALAALSLPACVPPVGPAAGEGLDRLLEMQKELQRRHEQIETMHRVILKQQQALDVAEASLGSAQNRSVDNEELVERQAADQEELKRRHEQINTMHNIILKQQCAVEVAKANLRNAENRRIAAEAELKMSREELDRLRAEKARLK